MTSNQRKTGHIDHVEEADIESFPASDPPAWAWGPPHIDEDWDETEDRSKAAPPVSRQSDRPPTSSAD